MPKVIDIHPRPKASSELQPMWTTQCVTGWLVWTEPEDPPRVDFVGNARAPLPARSTVELPSGPPAQGLCEVLLVFERGLPDRPIIVGLLRDETQALDTSETEVHVDGRRVEIEAADELVLRCGSASITLRRNGRMVLRGTYLETRAEGTNRIRGGNVSIN